MTIAYAKPPVVPAWADQATPADIVQPSNSFIEAGWLQTPDGPNRENFNWVLNYATWGVRYLMQNGVPAFDPQEVYSSGGITLGPDTMLWQSIENNNVNQVPAATPAAWDIPRVSTAPGADNSTRIANTSWVSGEIEVAIQGAAFIKSGAFTASITGITGVANIPFRYTIVGNMASIWATQSFYGAVATTAASWSIGNLPAAIAGVNGLVSAAVPVMFFNTIGTAAFLASNRTLTCFGPAQGGWPLIGAVGMVAGAQINFCLG